jgi:hypothetical protein
MKISIYLIISNLFNLSLSFITLNSRISSSFVLNAIKKTELPAPETPAYVVGENVPETILKQSAIYDMILVERFSAPEKTSFGLFLPKIEGKDQKRLGKVIFCSFLSPFNSVFITVIIVILLLLLLLLLNRYYQFQKIMA